MPPSIGFDLDMTLIDSRPGIGAVYAALAEETGTFIDIDLVTSRLGPPLDVEMAHWFPAEQIPAAADRYRKLYPQIAIGRIEALPGAREALAAARERGRVIVITAKHGPNARLHVDALGLDVDEVIGGAWRDGKATILREQSSTLYIGDHVHDMEAAAGAGIPGLGVTSGPCSADELRGAGAIDVLTSLTEFSDWCRCHDT